MNVCDRMTEDWAAISSTPAAAARQAAWAEREVALAGYRTPAALVAATVGADPAKRAAALSALIRQGRDPFAARTALQLLLPALARVPLFVGYRCAPIASPGDEPDAARTELLGSAWEELSARAGTEVADPEVRIVRSAADRLRTRRRRAGRTARRVQPTDNLGDGAAVELDWGSQRGRAHPGRPGRRRHRRRHHHRRSQPAGRGARGRHDPPPGRTTTRCRRGPGALPGAGGRRPPGPHQRMTGQGPARPLSGDSRVAAGVAAVAGGLAGLVVAAGAISALVFGRGWTWPPSTMWAVVIEGTVTHPGRPAAGWPPPLGARLPGPGPYWATYAALAVTVAVLAAAGAANLGGRRPQAGRDGRARPAQLRAQASLRAARRVKAHTRPGLPAWPRPAPTELGYPLGRSHPGGVALWASWEASTRVVAPPGAGKTYRVLARIVRSHPGPVIATSTKADLCELTATARRRDHRPVVCLDPEGLCGSAGIDPVRWSPVAGCDDSMVAERRAVALLAATGERGDERHGRFFVDSARDVLKAYLHAAALCDGNISTVLGWSRRIDDPTPGGNPALPSRRRPGLGRHHRPQHHRRGRDHLGGHAPPGPSAVLLQPPARDRRLLPAPRPSPRHRRHPRRGAGPSTCWAKRPGWGPWPRCSPRSPNRCSTPPKPWPTPGPPAGSTRRYWAPWTRWPPSPPSPPSPPCWPTAGAGASPSCSPCKASPRPSTGGGSPSRDHGQRHRHHRRVRRAHLG